MYEASGKRYKTVLGYKRGTSIAGAAMVAVAARRNRYPRVKGAIKPSGRTELKYVDVANATYACNTTGTITALNLIAVGDDNTTRDGRQVTIKSVQLHGMVYPEDTNSGPTKARVVLVWDNAVNSGALPAITDIFAVIGGNAFPLVNNANRFTILVDRTFSCGIMQDTATQAVAGCPNTFECEIYKSLGAVTQFSGTTAAIGSIQNGGLYLVTMGSTAAGNGATLIASTRVRFVDD